MFLSILLCSAKNERRKRRPLCLINAVLLRNMFLFILLCSAKNEPRSAAAVTGLIARAATPRSGAAELALLKQSSPFSLLGCRPRCPINAVCFAICFLLLIKGRLLQCSEACFCPFFFAARRTNGESAAAVIGLFARTPPRRLFCFAAKYLLFVIFAPIYSAYCKKMAYNFCFL